ncbi:hypothetical protein A2U01_0035885, partial [Trifolium medium]|nr:hypothetical protein [Trifolium medium]
MNCGGLSHNTGIAVASGGLLWCEAILWNRGIELESNPCARHWKEEGISKKINRKGKERKTWKSLLAFMVAEDEEEKRRFPG